MVGTVCPTATVAFFARAGRLISEADMLIAATALVHGPALVANNAGTSRAWPGSPWQVGAAERPRLRSSPRATTAPSSRSVGPTSPAIDRGGARSGASPPRARDRGARGA